MGMASGAQDDLWKSVEHTNFGQYYRLSESMSLTLRRDGRKQNVPLRVYIKSGLGKLLTHAGIPETTEQAELNLVDHQDSTLLKHL